MKARCHLTLPGFLSMASSSKDVETESYPLHKSAFNNDVKAVEDLLKSGADINLQDCHGNTPLIIAVMLGHKDIISLLLKRGALIRIKNNDGWSALLEAVSYGNREIIATMLFLNKKEAIETLANRKPYLLKMLTNLNDFYLELKWDFQTWIPLLSKILPSDTCKIYKRDCALRMDTTLVDFNDRSWERGDISFLFNPENERVGQHFIVMDNKKKVFQKIFNVPANGDLSEQVDMVMSNDLVTLQCSTKTISFTRAMAGWIFKHEKSEDVGGFNSNYYMVEGLNIVTRKRREHLTSEDIKKNKALIQEFATGVFRKGSSGDDNDNKMRKSLPPPLRPSISWSQYVTLPVCPQLGRCHIEKKTVKEFKAVIAMSEDFPLSVDILVDVLEIISPFKHINKLREFCSGRLPPGFPVKLEIPLLPTISAKITFQKFEWRDDLSPKFFTIPRDYAEDNHHFTDL